ncbi:MAG: type I 3-dehydroquinate dehydratase [Deltaproteobacteria bacterium]|nr:type I 3-dehydroquinate dehydratase [Deltaproteobacteria bacterium]
MEELTERVASSDARLRAAGLDAPLHEVRLDALRGVDDDVFDAIARFAGRAIVCCRPSRQGGNFVEGEGQRLELLRRAARRNVRLVDVEEDVGAEVIGELGVVIAKRADLTPEEAPRGLLVSLHDLTGFPPDLEARLARMRTLGGAALKLAVTVRDAAELGRLLDLRRTFTEPAVLLGMGPAGRLSRTHYPAFGSPFTFVAASAERATAPGQLSLDEALELGMPATSARPLCALVGGERMTGSPGPRVYNRLFRAQGRTMSYVPVLTHDLRQALTVLNRVGAIGLSVTMPHKLAALEFARADATAHEVGAANSLRLRDGWEATNTDVAGIAVPLARAIAARPLRRAVILGAGGAARAAVVASRQLGLEVTVCARNVEAARALVGGGGHARPWRDRGEEGPLTEAVLVNATPVHGDESPWPAERTLDAAVVFDTALGSPSSRLLTSARRAGALVVTPLDMWFAQGATQMSWILDEHVDPRMLEELA